MRWQYMRMAMVYVEGGFFDVRETVWADSSALALFASRLYDKRKKKTSTYPQKKKETKTAEVKDGLEHGRVLTLHLDPRLT